MFGSSLVYMHAGHGMREIYVPINTICERIGKDMSNCLPACRALTGCGTTSSLYRIGKTCLPVYQHVMHNCINNSCSLWKSAANRGSISTTCAKSNVSDSDMVSQPEPKPCYGVLLARGGLSEMGPFKQCYLQKTQHLQKWGTLLTCIAKMQSVERVESASASLLAFAVRSSAPAVQNVKMCPLTFLRNLTFNIIF